MSSQTSQQSAGRREETAMETNYLQTSLRALGDQVDTCTLCGAIVNPDYREVHDRTHA
jgi:hypothetical protein